MDITINDSQGLTHWLKSQSLLEQNQYKIEVHPQYLVYYSYIEEIFRLWVFFTTGIGGANNKLRENASRKSWCFKIYSMKQIVTFKKMMCAKFPVSCTKTVMHLHLMYFTQVRKQVVNQCSIIYNIDFQRKSWVKLTKKMTYQSQMSKEQRDEKKSYLWNWEVDTFNNNLHEVST